MFALGSLGMLCVAADTEWRTYGGDKGFQRYSPLDQINRTTLSNLDIAWSRPSLDTEYKDKFPDLNPSNYLRATPIMVNGMLYASNGVGLIEAFDPATGKTKWIQKPFPNSFKEAAGQSLRGVEYWRGGPGGKDERIIAIRGQFLYSINAKSGEPDYDFGDRGKVFLRWPTTDNVYYRASNGPMVVNDVIVIGGTGGAAFAGGSGDLGNQKEAAAENIRGYDVKTGRLLWTFHVVPEAGQPGNETWGKESWKYVGSIGNWGPMTADEKLGMVYVPLTAPTLAYYGGHRPGNNLYANSLVALNVKTGKPVWHFQMVHHDLWDYDNAAPPVLGDIRVNGKLIRAVMQANKNGFLFVFDRETGKPVWPIEERPVPQSTVPGEATSPTQPFPTKPPPFDRQGLSEADLIDFTPELHKEAQEIARHYVLGPLFTPPSVLSDEPDGKKGSLIVPGVWGSGNWNTGAFDPETGMYYAVSRTVADVFALTKQEDPRATIDYTIIDFNPEPPNPQNRRFTTGIPQEAPQGAGPRPGLPKPPVLPSGLPIFKPPYGRITAFDLNKGDLVWQVANGDDGLRNNAALQGLNVPPLGSNGRPAPLVTKTLLFLGDSSDAVSGRAGTHGAVQFRAYDKATGQVLWEHPLPAGTTGAPMTYSSAGKQYIVVPVGGQDYGAGWIAFTLKSPAANK